MKKLYLLIAMAFMVFTAQAQITGTVTDGNSGDPLIGASVMIKGSTIGTITDVDGRFSLANEKGGDCQLEISYLGFQTILINVADGATDVGSITLKPGFAGMEEVVITGFLDIVQDRRTPVAVSTITPAEIQAKGVGNVEFPEIMKNTPSVYVSSQTGFGDSQMWMRGFDQINTAFLLNGQPINGMEDGRMYWSNWSGMSDVANLIQIQRGLGSSKLAISSVGGTVNIVTKTVDNSQGGSVRLVYGNDNYLKGTFSYSSGLQGKWAYSFLIDHWQADDKWAEGTQGKGQNYFASIGFKPNDKSTFNFLITGAPQSHGQRWSQSAETLEATPKFNQHWGLHDGEFKSERFNYYHKPVLNLSWDYAMSEKTNISSVLYASFGRGGGTGNYGSSSNRIRTADGQVDWDAIQVNNTADTDGIGDFGGNYARRASVNNHQWFGNVTNVGLTLSDYVSLDLGVDFRFYSGDHFRQLVDLFGLDSWQDSFRHATRGSDYTVSGVYDADPWASLSNFADVENRIAYDYSEDINYQGAFGQLEYAKDKFTTFVQTSVSNQSYQREGRWSDIGTSEKITKIGYNLKGGLSYAVNDASVIFANGGFYSRQPFLDNIFDNIRYSNDLISPSVDNESVTGLEVGYKYAAGNFSTNINLYNTTWGNRSLVSAFTNENGTPDDDSDDFTQRDIERGLEQTHKGFELDAMYKIDKLKIRGHFTYGDWTFNAIESVTSYNDDTGEEIGKVEGQDISGVHIPNAPQFAFGLGVNYEVFENFSAFIDINYFDKIYRRDNFASDVREDIGTLDPYELIDFGISYRFDLGSNYLTWRANVYNLLDKDYINQSDRFGLLNGNGRTWNTSLRFYF